MHTDQGETWVQISPPHCWLCSRLLSPHRLSDNYMSTWTNQLPWPQATFQLFAPLPSLAACPGGLLSCNQAESGLYFAWLTTGFTDLISYCQHLKIQRAKLTKMEFRHLFKTPVRSGPPGFSPPVSYTWLSRLIPNPRRAKVLALPCPFPLLCLSLVANFSPPFKAQVQHQLSSSDGTRGSSPRPKANCGRVCLHCGASAL